MPPNSNSWIRPCHTAAGCARYPTSCCMEWPATP